MLRTVLDLGEVSPVSGPSESLWMLLNHEVSGFIVLGRREEQITLAAEKDGVGNSGAASVRGAGFERCGQSAPLDLHQETALQGVEMSVVAFLHADAEIRDLNPGGNSGA